MEINTIIWCIEAPQGNFLREVISTDFSHRLVFTNRWDDGAMKFGMRKQAEKFIDTFGLDWLEITEHMDTY